MKVTMFLIDVLGDTKVGTTRQDVKTRLDALYKDCFDFANRATPHPNPPHTFDVVWSVQKPTPSDTDIVIYFIPADCGSIAAKWRGKSRDPVGESHWGFTDIKFDIVQGQRRNAEAASEVRVMSFDGKALGSIAFHEMLHHKLLEGNAMHNKDGLAAASVSAGTGLNDQNRRDVASTISRPIKQWTGGWDILTSVKARREGGDSFWYQF